MASSTQLLILGNGFDLHCGLKSSYRDFFYNTILDTTTVNFSVLHMRAGVSGFWETLLFRYFIKYKAENYNWCDIETIIKNTLCSVFFGDDSSSTDIEGGIWKSVLRSLKTDHDPTDDIKNIKDTIRKFLFQYCLDFFYNKIYSLKKYSDQYYLELLTEHLLKELHSFEKRFCKYIKCMIVNPDDEDMINDSYILNAINLIAKLTGFHSGSFKNLESIVSPEVKEVEEKVSSYQSIIKSKKVNVLSKEFAKLKQVHILSFNYTSPFDILGVQSPCLYSNVHGKLCNKNCIKGCDASNVIFGIDDAFTKSQNEFTELRKFSKTYRKMFDTTAPASVLPPNNGAPIEIKFYGHSLSEADYSYFQSIFDYYQLYSNSNGSLLFYCSKGYEQTDEIYRLINSYGKTLANKEQGKNLIHKLLLENRLKIVEIS